MVRILHIRFFICLFFVILVLAFGYHSYERYQYFDVSDCDSSRDNRILLSSNIDLDDVDSARLFHMGVGEIEFGGTDQFRKKIVDEFKNEISNYIRISSSSSNTVSTNLTDVSTGHFNDREYGRGRRVISMILCADRHLSDSECRRMEMPFYGRQRHAFCDIEQAVRLFFEEQ